MILRTLGGGRSSLALVLSLLICATARAEPPPPSSDGLPSTAFAWLAREHQFLRRYLAVVRQAVHDYRYGYATPKALMPVTIDLFTGYVAPLHQMEERFLYPALRERMNAGQREMLDLIEADQRKESEVVKRWQQALETAERSGSPQPVVDHIDYFGQLLNRHLVFQEERLFPLFDTLLTPKEQAALLARIAGLRRTVFGKDGARRYEQLLAAIEQQIDAIAGRIW